MHADDKKARSRKRDRSVTYGQFQNPMAERGERKARSDSLGAGPEGINFQSPSDTVTRGRAQGESHGSIYREGSQHSVSHEAPTHQKKGLYKAQSRGQTNGVVGNPRSGMSSVDGTTGGRPSDYMTKSGKVSRENKAKQGGVYPSQSKGYKGRG